MPLFSEHISNMYYSGSPYYTSSPYGYNSSVLPLGNSYSASYLNSGGNYSNHSSLGSYSRTPLTSRWISGVGRNYSPMLSTISERSAASPARINSPRRIPITKRSYGSSGYITRPININTADIDVSKDKYRKKPESPVTSLPQRKESPRNEKEKENSPFMPRVDGKPETGIDSSPGVPRSTIKRGRTVVRLHTIRRKDRDSPRKPAQSTQNNDVAENSEKAFQKETQDPKSVPQESTSWRERLSDDLVFKDKKIKKTLGTKLAEKFMVRDINKEDTPEKEPTDIPAESEVSQNLPVTPLPGPSKSPDRRCSMEILAEQAQLLDSLIRKENLSIAPLDLSKVGIENELKNNVVSFGPIKRRKSNDKHNPLKTTQSDHSLHESLKSFNTQEDYSKNLSKKRSLKKSSSGGSICRLDSITEFPKEPLNINLPAIDETKIEAPVVKSKPKLKTKITASVEVSPPKSPLKFRIDDVIVEEKPRILKKEITFSSEVHESPTLVAAPLENVTHIEPKEVHKSKKIPKKKLQSELPSPEPEDGNFWNKIGKRETVYLMKRKQHLQEAKEKHKRPFIWLPEEESLNENEAEEDKVDIQDDSSAAKTLPINDNIILKNEGSSTTMSTEIKTADQCNLIQKNIDTDTLINKDIKTCSLKEEGSCNSKTKEISTKVDSPKQSSENMHVLKNIQVKEKDHKENDLINKKLYEPHESKNTVVNKELNKTSQNEDILKNKTLLQNEQEKVMENKENSQKIVLEDKFIKDLPEKDLALKHNQLIEFSQEDNGLKNTDTNELSYKRDEIPPVCSFTDTSVISNPCIFEQESENETSLKNQNPVKEQYHSETKNIYTESHENENHAVKATIGNDADSIGKLIQNDKTEVKEKQKSLSPKEVKTKPTPTKIKSSKKKDSSKKSSSNKMCEKKSITVSLENSTKISEMNTDNIEVKVIDSKINEQDGIVGNKQNTPLSKTEQDIKPSANSEKDNTKLDLEKVQTSLLSDNDLKNTMQEQKELPESNLEEITGSEANSSNDASVSISSGIPEIQTVIGSENIPINEDINKSDRKVQEEKKAENNVNAETTMKKDEEEADRPTVKTVVKLPEPPNAKKPVKQEAALRPLIATPRPLQKRAPQVIHSSESSDSSSEDETSDEEHDECDASEDSEEFFECEANPDGRTSTGSNDSGFDSSAPTSPAGFQQIRKDCDVNCHRKCEKLTANLCGVNQRLLVEALATRTASKKGADVPGTSTSVAVHNNNSTDILEQELEQSTAYGIFRKTGRFTPPARSIPRFRKYTIEDFHFIKVLGKGSFGKVLLAELRDTEYYYAVKCLKKDVVLEDDDVECTLIERKVLALGTNHPYLCHLFATFQTDSHLFFVMEYLNGGDLMFHIQQSGRFPEARARFYAAEIVSGLKFLHKRGIIYRDLKLDNILLDFDGHVRIADFGMCKLQIYLDKTADTFCGTPDYMAPEIIKGLKYNQTVDWWSFGVLLYEMLIGQSPFSGCDEDELFWSICNEMPSYPRFLSQEALTILTRLLDKDARSRLGGTECMHGDIREQAFFQSIHWDRLERRDLEAPFRPRVRHPLDTQYFDRAFTGERPRLTAVEPHVLRSMDQEPFRGFSYTNPNATDR
ncbi:interaptin isoform X1 [Manduca sexta]|uniref:interaptin isoform X1 n=1 Tax=Manduca sexta TaxID=7130 RepID=UPI001183661B|nr:interaptin isoform X1 [Manduca sexta]